MRRSAHGDLHRRGRPGVGLGLSQRHDPPGHTVAAIPEPSAAAGESIANTPLPNLPPSQITPPPLPNWSDWMPDLPGDLRQASLAYAQHCLVTCKPHRRRHKALHVLGEFRRFWSWQLAYRPVTQLAELRLSDLQAYQTHGAATAVHTSTADRTLRYVMAVLRERADQGQPVNLSVFRFHERARPDSLPRHLSDSDIDRLEAYVRSQLHHPDPLTRLQHACFFVLAHTGLRASECVDLQVQDLDLPGQRLTVRQGKGQRDRIVYLSDVAGQALVSYLAPCLAQPLRRCSVDPTASRSPTIGCERVSAHSVRLLASPTSAHTDYATPWLPLAQRWHAVSRIQKLLGHQQISTTMIYAACTMLPSKATTVRP